MKTYNNFYLDVISLPNLYRAYEKAKKGKAEKKEVIEFSKNLHENLLKLHLELLNRTYLMGDYKMFFVNDYKTRKIMAPRFKDMIVQHALFNFLEQIYEKSFIFDSYACRKNKGTHKAFKRLKSFINKSSYDDYFVKCDITKYFYSIDHQRLKQIIRRKIIDKDILQLIDKFIDSHKEEIQEYHIISKDLKNSRKGIPIGNLLSQLFANIYLNELDYFVKQGLKIKFYVRYVDDFVFIVKEKKEISNLIIKIQEFLKNELFLKIEDRKININKISFGIDFVGYVGFKKYTKVRTRNYKRFVKSFKNKIILVEKSKLDFNNLELSFTSYLGHLSHTNSNFLKKKIFGIYLKAVTNLNTGKAVKRGGNWNNGADAGLFSAYLNNAPSNSNTNIGFRCCSVPQTDAVFSRKHSQFEVQNLLLSSLDENKSRDYGFLPFFCNENKLNLNTNDNFMLSNDNKTLTYKNGY